MSFKEDGEAAATAMSRKAAVRKFKGEIFVYAPLRGGWLDRDGFAYRQRLRREQGLSEDCHVRLRDASALFRKEQDRYLEGRAAEGEGVGFFK